MAENRYKSGRKKGFVVLMRDVAQDTRLSLEARGLFALMMSLPEDWEFNVGGLAKLSGCGKDKLRRMLGELEKVGYLAREQAHDSGGKFAGNVYVLQDEAPPSSGKPDNGEEQKSTVAGKTDNGFYRERETTLPANPTLTKEDSLSEEDRNNTPLPPKGAKRASTYDLAEDAKPVLRDYCGEDKELAWALASLIDVRREKRAINSKRGISALLAELDRLSQGDRQQKLLLLRQSTANSWKSVFPLKGGYTTAAAPSRVQEEEGAYDL